MRNLAAALSNDQAEILSWLLIGVKSIKVDVDLSEMQADDECRLEFENVVFQQYRDGTWGSLERFGDLDEDGDLFRRDGELMIHPTADLRSLVYLTLDDLATFNLSMAFEWEIERRSREANIYAPCASPGACSCWRHSHRHQPVQHKRNCVLCRSIGDNDEIPEEEIPF